MTETTAEPASGAEHSDSPQPTPAAGTPIWLMPALIIAGLIAGIAGEWLIVSTSEVFMTPSPGTIVPSPEYLAEVRWDMIRNRAIGFGAFGALAIGLVGLVTGIARSTARGGVGFVLGAVSGVIAGGLTGPIGYLTGEALFTSMMEGMLKAILILGPVYVALCIMAAALSAVLSADFKLLGRGLVVGAASSVFAMLLYLLTSVLVFPIGRPEAIVPEHTGTRYAAYVIGALFMAIAAGIATRPAKVKQAGGASVSLQN